MRKWLAYLSLGRGLAYIGHRVLVDLVRGVDGHTNKVTNFV